MSTFNSDVMGKQLSVNAKDRVQGGAVSGRVAYVDAMYKTNKTEQGGDAIAIAELPVGAVLLPDLCRVFAEACGGSTTIAILGDSADLDRYSATAVSVVAAGISSFTPTNAIMVTPWVITSATTSILATLSSTPSNEAKLRFRLAYLMP
jgi:hypothetical protein